MVCGNLVQLRGFTYIFRKEDEMFSDAKGYSEEDVHLHLIRVLEASVRPIASTETVEDEYLKDVVFEKLFTCYDRMCHFFERYPVYHWHKCLCFTDIDGAEDKESMTFCYEGLTLTCEDIQRLKAWVREDFIRRTFARADSQTIKEILESVSTGG